MDFRNAKLLVFDLDYTLMDTSAGIVFCFNETRRLYGEPAVDPELLKARIGYPINETFALYGSADPEGRRDVFRRLAREGGMASRSFLLPGVAETLPVLRARGYTLAIASTKSHAEIARVCVHLDVDRWFAAYVGSDEVPAAKPAPDPLLLVMTRVGIGPAETVYTGDHLVDISSARAAGVRVIALHGQGGPCPLADVRAAAPDALVGAFAELLDLF
jgi:phosphoglycolate phosphatase